MANKPAANVSDTDETDAVVGDELLAKDVSEEEEDEEENKGISTNVSFSLCDTVPFLSRYDVVKGDETIFFKEADFACRFSRNGKCNNPCFRVDVVVDTCG